MLTKVVCTHSLDRTNKQSSSLPNTVVCTYSLDRTNKQSSSLPNTITDQVRQNNKWTVLHPSKHKHWSGWTEKQVNSPPPDKKQTPIRSDRTTSEQSSTWQKTNADQIRLNKWTALQVSSKVLCWRPCCQCQGAGQQNQTRGQMWAGQMWAGQMWAAHTHKQPQASRAPTDDLQPCFSQSWRYQSSPSEHRDTRSHHLQSNLTPVCSAHVPQSEMMLQAFETNPAFKVSPSVWNACWL